MRFVKRALRKEWGFEPVRAYACDRPVGDKKHIMCYHMSVAKIRQLKRTALEDPNWEFSKVELQAFEAKEKKLELLKTKHGAKFRDYYYTFDEADPSEAGDRV